MKVVWFFADGFTEFNSSYFTCVIPHNALESLLGAHSEILHIHEWMDNTPNCIRACADADTIILQRVLVDDAVPTAKYWMERGKRILVSFDDAYQLIGEENAAYKFWGKGEVDIKVPGLKKYIRKLAVHPVDQFRKNLKVISGGLTPSEVLANDWKPYAPITYLPNYVESHRYKNIEVFKGSRINVGWGGSLSHLTSFSHSGVEAALRSFLDKNKVARLALIGDKRVRKQLGLPDESVWFREYVMFFDWPRVLASFDIGLAPLAMPYDQRRSRLKVMEYIAAGIPFIATKSEAYRDFWDADSGIFIDQGAPDICDKPNEKAWGNALEKMLVELDEYKLRAEKNIETYFDVYDSKRNAAHIANILAPN